MIPAGTEVSCREATPRRPEKGAFYDVERFAEAGRAAEIILWMEGIHGPMNTERNEVATTRFYNELRKQIDGTLPAGHVYRLGNPGGILRSAGIPDLSIEMNAARLSNKSTQENHPFNLEDMMGLPDAVQKPLAVFDSATHSDSFVILTELRRGDLNYVVALQTNRRDGNILVNSIRSIYPKESSRIVNWINKGLLRYANKKGMADWISRQRSNSADAENPFGQSLASTIEVFQNPPCI